jgi:hypothetical protein
MKIVALLESMWTWRGYNEPGEEAPRFYRINPENFTGRRLYRVCGPEHTLIVTNSCRMIQRSANHHGTPDPEWVTENLNRAFADGCDLFLICGRVAQETFDKAKFDFVFPNIIRCDHPAARRWSNEKLDALRDEIATYGRIGR